MKDNATQKESALVCAGRQGDREALQRLLTQNWSWLKGLVYSVLADGRDLDDVLQDVCVRVIDRIHTLREPERFRPWLAVLARREALKHRLRVTRGGVPRNAASMPVYADGDDPLRDVERKELYGRIMQAVKTLPQAYREVFVLAHSGGLTYARIAEVLDIPMTTVQIRLLRARRMVRNQVMDNSEQVHRR